MSRPSQVRVRAYAKINLTLHVEPREADGYHPLETVFQSLALHDTLTCTATRGAFRLTCDDPAVPTDTTNLVWRAAQALWTALGRDGQPTGCRIAIAKQIPSAAGLGGGSADAAATLVALNRLWAADATDADLMDLAAELGADVPFVLFGGTALGLGRGERLFPLEDLAPRWVVLACPSFGVSTAEAYGWFDADPVAAADVDPCGFATWDAGMLALHNDLQGPVGRRHPEILELSDTLLEAGADGAAMTGSGSAVFGLFTTETKARRAARRVAEAGAQAILTQTADRAACRKMLGLRAIRRSR